MAASMVGCMAEVGLVGKAKKVTITLTQDLLAILDGIGRREKTTRSGAVARLLRRASQAEVESQMAEGYRVMAEENLRQAELSLPAQAEVILRDDPQRP